MGRVSLLKVGGICAILYSIVLVVFFILGAANGLLEPLDAAEVLPLLEENQAVAATGGWILVFAPMLIAVAGLGFFQALRQAGPLMWVALVAFSGGGFLIVYRGFIWLAMTYELAPAYVAAAEGTKSTLAIVGNTLISFASMGDSVGAVLIPGIGVLLFSLAILRTTVAPKWLAWPGFLAALAGGWFTFLGPVAPAEVFEIISLIGLVAWIVWMVAMGITLLRASEPAGGLEAGAAQR